MSSIECNGVTTRYEISGPHSAPVVIFSHSLGASLEMWRPQLAELAESYRVLLYDTRGHGGSGLGSSSFSTETLGRDVLALLDDLAIEQAHFCGLSMGGVIGQWLGVHAPERLLSLVLANTAAKIGTAESWNGRIATVERDGLGAVIPGTLERWFTAGFRSSHPETVAGIEAMLRKTDPAGYLACCAAIRDADFRSMAHVTAPGIAVPTLLIAGQHDPVTTPEDLRFLAEAIPRARYVELDAAHLSSVEASHAFSNALLDFFAPLG
jgi:3-oxoadipate enol-lactonase